MQNLEISNQPNPRNIWASVILNIAIAIALGCLFFGVCCLIKFIAPAPKRNQVFDFSWIFTLLFTIAVSLVAAALFGWKIAKRGGKTTFSVLGIGAIWGATEQLVITLISVLGVWTSDNRYIPPGASYFYLSGEWPKHCVNDLLVFPLLVGAFVLTGFIVQQRDWKLGILCVVLIALSVILFFNYYLILF